MTNKKLFFHFVLLPLLLCILLIWGGNLAVALLVQDVQRLLRELPAFSLQTIMAFFPFFVFSIVAFTWREQTNDPINKVLISSVRFGMVLVVVVWVSYFIEAYVHFGGGARYARAAGLLMLPSPIVITVLMYIFFWARLRRLRR